MRASILRTTLLATAATLLLASTALGAEPGRQVIPVNDTFVADPGTFFNPCSQPLTGVVTGTLYLTGYFDQSGNLVRLLLTEPQFTVTITGPNGNSLTSLRPASAHTSIANDIVTVVVAGQIWRFTLPGSGSVLAIAGNDTSLYALDGSLISQTFSGESVVNAAAYCTYLGAN